MLKARVITAIIVAPLALAALLLLEPTSFRAFIAIVLGVCAWEWANFAYLQQPGRIGFAVAVGLLTFFAPLRQLALDRSWLVDFHGVAGAEIPKFPLILKRPAIKPIGRGSDARASWCGAQSFKGPGGLFRVLGLAPRIGLVCRYRRLFLVVVSGGLSCIRP